MRPNRLQNALAALGDAMLEVNAAIEEMRREQDPLASHIFISRRVTKRNPTPRVGNSIISRLASVGSRHVTSGFAESSPIGRA
jgi:hypothetical protein